MQFHTGTSKGCSFAIMQRSINIIYLLLHAHSCSYLYTATSLCTSRGVGSGLLRTCS